MNANDLSASICLSMQCVSVFRVLNNAALLPPHMHIICYIKLPVDCVMIFESSRAVSYESFQDDTNPTLRKTLLLIHNAIIHT